VWNASAKTWKSAGRNQLAGAKGWGDDGLIDQAFQQRFIVVLPDEPSANPQIDAWVKTESEHFIQRWRSLMRGDPIVKKSSELKDIDQGIYCVWGDPKSNGYLAKQMEKLSLKWTADELILGSKTYDVKTHVPVMSCGWRNGNDTGRLILNSGLTFREAHDRTNSLQNPKLPDWAILDITSPPTAEAAGKVVAADFFDENWRVKE
jgi:hypothetical protein